MYDVDMPCIVSTVSLLGLASISLEFVFSHVTRCELLVALLVVLYYTAALAGIFLPRKIDYVFIHSRILSLFAKK